MSLHMLYTIIQLLPLRTPGWSNSVEDIADEGWSFWLYLLASRRIHSIIISLILVCFIMNIIKSKVGNNWSEIDIKFDSTDWINRFWRQLAGSYLNVGCGSFGRSYSSSGIKFNTFDIENELLGISDNSVMDKLITAEEELEALKNALELAKKVSNDLSETVKETEIEKHEIEGKSETEMQQISDEIQSAKADLTILKEQLDSLRKVKENVMQKCKNLEVEALKAEEALKLRQEMQQKLDESLYVVNMLKGAITSLENKPDNMTNLSGSYLDKVEPGDNMQENVFINNGHMVKYPSVADMNFLGQGDDRQEAAQRLMEEWDNDPGTECDQRDYSHMIINSWSRFSLSINADQQSEFQQNNIKQRYNIESLTDNNDDTNEQENYADNDSWRSEDYDDEIEISDFQLTNSLAFKQFLQTNFK